MNATSWQYVGLIGAGAAAAAAVLGTVFAPWGAWAVAGVFLGLYMAAAWVFPPFR